MLKAKLALKKKDYSEAVAEAGRVLKMDESDLDALLVRGNAYLYLADHDVALRYPHSYPYTSRRKIKNIGSIRVLLLLREMRNMGILILSPC